MKSHAFFKRISSDEAISIATQVTLGILSETKDALASTQKELVTHVPETYHADLYKEIESNLRTRGVYAKFQEKEE